jgi:cytochrome P450
VTEAAVDARSARPASMATPEGRTAVWRGMRERGAVYQLPDGRWMLTSAEAVEFAYRHVEFFSSSPLEGIHTELPVRTIPAAIDPPEHRGFRRLLDTMFAPRVINAIDDELRRQVRDLVSAVARTGRCDVMADLAALYPTSVFLALFGLPLADRDQLIGWVSTMVEQTHRKDASAQEQSKAASWAIYDYMTRYIEEKRARPGDDVLSRILSLDGDDAWPLDDVIGFSIGTTMAGLDTVTSTIGSVMLYLADDPAVRRRVVADPDVARAFVEEVVRLEPAAPMLPRLTTRDVEVCGVRIPEGSIVMLNVATANRDPARFSTPDAIDLEHSDRGHLSFGGGVHRCLGSHLARRELRLVLDEFLGMVPEYEVEPGFIPEVEWPSGTVRLRSLPIIFPIA